MSKKELLEIWQKSTWELATERDALRAKVAAQALALMESEQVLVLYKSTMLGRIADLPTIVQELFEREIAHVKMILENRCRRSFA